MTALDLLQGVPLLALVGAGIWLLRLEGRVSTHEAVCAERYRRLEEKHDEALLAIRELGVELRSRLDRVSS